MYRKARLLTWAVAALAVVALVAGCGRQDADDQVGAPATSVRVSGSGTCLPLLRLLTAAYSEKVDDVEFVYLPGLHSSGGIKGVASGDLEIGAVSRELNNDEKKLGLRYVKLSDDGLVLAVHPSVTIDGLTTKQVRAIYSGSYVNWSQLGGPDLPITVLDRNEDESAKMILREYVLSATKVAPRAVDLFYESDMVESLQSARGAIGYFSLGYGLSSSPPVNVRYLALDGVAATVKNIENGTYKVIRPLGMVVANGEDEHVEAFIEWATSPETVELMASKGFAPAANTER